MGSDGVGSGRGGIEIDGVEMGSGGIAIEGVGMGSFGGPLALAVQPETSSVRLVPSIAVAVAARRVPVDKPRIPSTLAPPPMSQETLVDRRPL